MKIICNKSQRIADESFFPINERFLYKHVQQALYSTCILLYFRHVNSTQTINYFYYKKISSFIFITLKNFVHTNWKKKLFFFSSMIFILLCCILSANYFIPSTILIIKFILKILFFEASNWQISLFIPIEKCLNTLSADIDIYILLRAICQILTSPAILSHIYQINFKIMGYHRWYCFKVT